jgi:hypothetical protein
MTGRDRPAEAADFSFFALDVSDLNDPERRFPLTAEDIRLLNPNTRTCPIFRTLRDAEITKEIYRRVPVLKNEWRENGSPWGAYYIRLIHYGDHAEELRLAEEIERIRGVSDNKTLAEGSLVPVYESKLVGQYDHRAGSYVGTQSVDEIKPNLKRDFSFRVNPRFFVRTVFFEDIMKKYSFPKGWFLAYRDVARSTDVRSVIATAIPRVAASIKLPVLGYDPALPGQVLLANLNAFAFDFAARQKLGGISLSFFILKQLSVLPPNAYNGFAEWDAGAVLRDWIAPRVLELTYTAWDLEPFARDLGYDGPPFRWDPERRFLLRCELDAAFFHLYDIERDDADYIMETFPIVKRKDEAAHGEYRTKRVILEIYDEMARATETSQPFQTLLDPPPVELDLATSESAVTVTPLRPREERPYLQPEESRPASIATEEKAPYGEGIKKDAASPTPERPQNLADATSESEDSSLLPPGHNGGVDEPAPNQRSDTPPEEATLFPDNEVETKDTIPSIEEAALALHACVPEGEKVQREKLLLDVARELGHTRLAKKIRRALNKALNAEHNKRRLKTDWQLVWKSRKK